MPDIKEGPPVLSEHGHDAAQVRPSLDSVKATAAGIRNLGGSGDGKSSKLNLLKGIKKNPSTTPAAPAAVLELPAPFKWERKDVELIGDAPFDLGYVLGGPEHEHWIKARDQLKGGSCYEKMSYVLNRVGARDPLYIVLALGIVEYAGGLARCAVASLQIWQAGQDAARRREIQAAASQAPK